MKNIVSHASEYHGPETNNLLHALTDLMPLVLAALMVASIVVLFRKRQLGGRIKYMVVLAAILLLTSVLVWSAAPVVAAIFLTGSFITAVMIVAEIVLQPMAETRKGKNK